MSQLLVGFETEACCKCGILMVIESGHQSQLRNNKNTFYCLNGHPQSYTESEADRLRKELAQKQMRVSDLLIEIAELKKPKPRKKRAKTPSKPKIIKLSDK